MRREAILVYTYVYVFLTTTWEFVMGTNTRVREECANSEAQNNAHVAKYTLSVPHLDDISRGVYLVVFNCNISIFETEDCIICGDTPCRVTKLFT